MSFVVLIPIADDFDLIDNASAPITGKVKTDFATVTAYLATNEATIAVVSVTELGGALAGLGKYRITFTPSIVGEWKSLVIYDAAGVYRRLVDSYDVVTASQDDPASAFPLGQLVSGQNPVAADGGRITLRRGVSYSTALDNALIWTYTDPMSLASATSITLSLHSRSVRIEDVATLTGSPPAQIITVELAGAQTDELLISQVTAYEMTALIGGNEVVLFTGDVSVLPDVSP